MILKDLLKQPPVSILIQDSCAVKGRPLFLSLIRNYSENGYSVRYFKYDSPLSSEKSEMEQLNFSWKTCILNESYDNSRTSIESYWCSDLANSGDRLVVAIDSLSPLLLNWTVGALASALRNLKKTMFAVVALVHGDVHGKETLQALNYIFPCHLTVQKVHGCNLCSGVWRKASGKLVDSDEYYSITDKWEIKDVKEVIEPSSNTVMDSLPKNAVPKSTFKLDLNAKEEEARSQVVLPYIRNKQTGSSTNETLESKIIYEAEAPDWDDEDPDDDLEI